MNAAHRLAGHQELLQGFGGGSVRTGCARRQLHIDDGVALVFRGHEGLRQAQVE
jgi:hypothetical protein